jgi:hypothetical protein
MFAVFRNKGHLRHRLFGMIAFFEIKESLLAALFFAG